MTASAGQADKHEEALKMKDEGNLAFKEKRYNKAIQLYTESLVLERNHLVFGNRAQTFIHLTQYELALRDINEALEMEPTFLKNLNRRAKVLAHLGMYSEALADSAAILRVNPKDKAAKEDAAAWEGKENLRSVEVKQWHGGEEFIEDEMISIPIEGLEAYDLTDVPADTVPPANTVASQEDPTVVSPVDTVATESKEEEEPTVVLHADTVADYSDQDTTYSSDKDTSSKDTTLSDDGSFTSDEDTVALEEPEDTVEKATVTPKDTVEEATVTPKDTVEEATVTPKDTVSAEDSSSAPSSDEAEFTVASAEMDTIVEEDEESDDNSSKFSDEEYEDTVPDDTVAKTTVAEATVPSKDTVDDASPVPPTVTQSPTASAAAVSPSSDETFLSAPDRSHSNESWEEVKNDSYTSSISDLHSMGHVSEDGYTTSPMTPNDTVDDEKEKKKEEEVASVDQSSPATVPEEVTVEKKKEEKVEQKEEEVPIVVDDSAATVPEETDEVKENEKEKEGKGDGQVPIVNESAATVPEEITEVDEKEEEGKATEQVTVAPTAPVEGTVETKDQEDTVVKKEKSTVEQEDERKEEEEVTVIDHPSPTVIPGPAKNFMEFVEHFKALKHDPPAFGNYFLTINPGIISMMLDIDHVRAIVDGLTVVAGDEVADLSAISTSLLTLCRLERFDIIVMFMNDDDKAKAHSLIDLLPSTQETALIRASFE